MSTVIFDNGVVESHPLYADCASSLNEISEKDYPKKNYFPEGISALDLDAYETKRSNANNDCTVDAVIGIADYHNEETNRRLQLIELRLNYKSAKNLSGKKMNSKINHSLALIGNFKTVDSVALFVFKEDVYYEAQRKIDSEKYASGSPLTWVTTSPSEFTKSILFKENIPYIPENDYEQIKSDIQSFLKVEKWQQVFDSLSFWGGKYFDYVRRYNMNEANLIKELIQAIYQECLNKMDSMSEDTRLYFELLEDDIQNII